ncbi:Tetratricopeptide TPR_2 repeat protein [Anaeromyxobacter sp. Fw109-5]|nr:Tetratricopeptide TPR_2 repeat protein [Anaeromyxobacter sp. Fw109-5]
MSGHPGAVRAPAGSGGVAIWTRRGMVALAVLLGACWYPKERGARLEQRVERIEGEAPAVQPGADAEAAREQARRVDATLAQVNTRLEALDRATRAGAPPPEGQAELVKELRQLRATLEQHGQRLDAVERSLAQGQQRSGAARVAESRPSASKTSSKPSAAAPAPGPAPGPALSANETDVLALARAQEQQGNKTVARELYEQYVAQFPADPASAEAHFRLGELAFGERRYRDAVLEFGKVAREFPRSGKAPDALVRTGEAMLQLDMREEAKTVLSEVPQRYPGTPAAARARSLLAETPNASTAAGKKRE